jgi:hypothetical protein
VSRLVEVLCVQARAEAESHTGAELDVVCQSGDTAVVDLGLYDLVSAGLSFCLSPVATAPSRGRVRTEMEWEAK